MRQIQKAGEPAELQAYRRTEGEPAPTYDTMPAHVVTALRAALRAEQHGLCCYCMRAIDGVGRIDHRASQKDHPQRQLDYRNLFLSCSGNLGGTHCDKKKGDDAINVDPLTVQAAWFGYGTAGTMSASRPDLIADLTTLGLNCDGLVSSRKAALARYLTTLDRNRAPSKPWPRPRLEKALSKLLPPQAGGRLEPYCEMLAFWLRRRIGRAK